MCDASCAVEIESSAVLEGFDATAVGLMYGGVFLLTLLAMHCQQVRASMQKGQGYAALGGHTHSNINTAAAERVGAGLPVVTLNADPST